MIAALEANLEEEMISFGRGLAGGEIYNDGEVEAFFTSRGALNGVLRTHLHNDDPTYVENKIQRMLGYFEQKGVRQIGWSLGQDCQPTTMANYLEKQGFYEWGESNVGMALDIAEMRVEERRVAGLEIREIERREDLHVMKQIEIEGFGSTEELAQHYYEMYSTVGFGKGTVWRHFSGWQNGRVVAATSLLFHAGVAGLYSVATIPEARRQGIARAMVLHAIEEARHAGYRIAVLSPTNMSEGIYRRLGFREYTVIRHYTHVW
jgi:ribosomal protein S18 acetylase RimI-like enzyme